MEMLRRNFGIAEPVKRQMERKITGAGEWRPMVLGGASGVHRDVLEGRDCEIDWEDVFTGECLSCQGKEVGGESEDAREENQIEFPT